MAIEAVSTLSIDNMRAQHQQDLNETIVKGILSSIGDKSYYVQEIERNVSLQESVKAQSLSPDLVLLSSDTAAFFERGSVLNEGMNTTKSTSLQEQIKQRQDLQQGAEIRNRFQSIQATQEGYVKPLDDGNTHSTQ